MTEQNKKQLKEMVFDTSLNSAETKLLQRKLINWVESLLKDREEQMKLDLVAYFSDYTVPLSMTAKDVQDIILGFK
jgi:hypothetical protein